MEEEKDDYDVFVKEMEEVIQLHEDGYDVKNRAKQLRRLALRTDPSTIPSGSIDIISISETLIAEITKPKEDLTQSVRHRCKIPIQNANNNPPNSPTKPNTRPLPLGTIFTILFALLCLIYYFRSPPPCPHPIW